MFPWKITHFLICKTRTRCPYIYARLEQLSKNTYRCFTIY